MKIFISIITATLNSASTINDCLKSVKNQKSKLEHIIIDGGSKDATLNLIESYEDNIKIISEPDRGIYDAINKGISIANGNIIGILNSDDFYVNEKVLGKVFNAFQKYNVDSCFGDLVYVSQHNVEKSIRKWNAGKYDIRKFYWGWMPPHPTFFAKRNVYEKFGLFNLNLGTAADYELMLRFLLKFKISTFYIPKVLVKMRTGGVSNVSLRNRLKANKNDRLAWKINGLRPYPWTTLLKPIRKIPQYFLKKN